MNLLEETMGEDIYHEKKSCCRMYFYYEINVGFEVVGYLIFLFRGIDQIPRKYMT